MGAIIWGGGPKIWGLEMEEGLRLGSGDGGCILGADVGVLGYFWGGGGGEGGYLRQTEAGLGSQFWGLHFRVAVLGLQFWGLRFWVAVLGSQFWGLSFWVSVLGSQFWGNWACLGSPFGGHF